MPAMPGHEVPFSHSTHHHDLNERENTQQQHDINNNGNNPLSGDIIFVCKEQKETPKYVSKSRRCHDKRTSHESAFQALFQTSVSLICKLRASHDCWGKLVFFIHGRMNHLLINTLVVPLAQGNGARLIDETGRSYLDTRNNVAHCGHNHPRIVQAIQNQVAILNTNTRYLHPNLVRLAKRLTDTMPSGSSLDVCFFCNSGSEANDLALRLARAYTGSNNTIVVDGAYHGHTLATLEVSPYKFEHSLEYTLQSADDTLAPTPGAHIYKVPCPDTFRGIHAHDSDAASKYADYIRQACKYYTHTRKENVGAFIVESGMSVAGVILPPPTYLQQCIDAVHDAGGVFIADEVQTGFGRLGSCFWAFEHVHSPTDTPVVPDIVTMGKPFGNGMPLAAVVTSRKIADAFESKGVEYFNTFGGNPVSAAAGLAVLDVIESEKLQERAHTVGSYLKSRFIDLQPRLDIIGDVRGSGLFLGVELVRNRETKEPASDETSFLCTTLKEKYSILTSIDGFHENVLVIKPPLCFSRADVDEFVSSFERAVSDDLRAVADVTSIPKTPT